MNRKSLILLSSVLLLLCSAMAFAQAPAPATPTPAPTPAPAPRLYLDGLGGLTFSHKAGGVFGGGVSVVLSKHVQVIVEVGRLTNVLPKSTTTALDAIAAANVAGGDKMFVFSAKMPGYYGLGGLRITAAKARGGLTPFAEGGLGVVHLRSDLTATSGGLDRTAAFKAAVGLVPTQTNAMLTLGAGLSVSAGKRSAVDVGYRYGRILANTAAITTNRVYLAIRIGI
jgi:opacity protein-like surface antigen